MDLDLDAEHQVLLTEPSDERGRLAPSPGSARRGAIDPALRDGLTSLEAQIEGLRRLAEVLAGTGAAGFAAAVALLGDCRGRVVVSGVGKSGIIGRKLASTLASTGTPALFVHPAEASHGDLGMITAGDALVVLSKSGASPELGHLLDYAGHRRLPVVAVTRDAASRLGRRADVVLLLPDAPEACPLGCAPTTSTTAMLALGDALAVALMRHKRFSQSEFRLRHPGGGLGRRLDRVEDLIDGDAPVPLVHLDAQMSEVVLVMARGRFQCAGVIDDHGALIGMIDERSMRAHMAPDLLGRRAAAVMSEVAVHIRADMMATEALDLMRALDLPVAIVTEGTRPIGVLHRDDYRHARAA